MCKRWQPGWGSEAVRNNTTLNPMYLLFLLFNIFLFFLYILFSSLSFFFFLSFSVISFFLTSFLYLDAFPYSFLLRSSLFQSLALSLYLHLSLLFFLFYFFVLFCFYFCLGEAPPPPGVFLQWAGSVYCVFFKSSFV